MHGIVDIRAGDGGEPPESSNLALKFFLQGVVDLVEFVVLRREDSSSGGGKRFFATGKGRAYSGEQVGQVGFLGDLQDPFLSVSQDQSVEGPRNGSHVVNFHRGRKFFEE